MVIQHRQRSHGGMPADRTLEIHLPQFIGLATFEPLLRWTMTIRLTDQIVPQKNPVDRTVRELHVFSLQYHLELARSPVRIPFSRPYHLGFQPGGGLLRASLRTPALLGNAGDSGLLIPLEPQITCGP